MIHAKGPTFAVWQRFFTQTQCRGLLDVSRSKPDAVSGIVIVASELLKSYDNGIAVEGYRYASAYDLVNRTSLSRVIDG